MKPYLPLALCALATLASAQTPPHHRHDAAVAAPASAPPGYGRFVREMEAGMRRMMMDMHAPGFAGDVDVDFLAMMIAHHEGAVEMARLELTYGRDPATRRLAEDIIASQTVEIEGMKRRLTILRSAIPPGGENFPALGGTRGMGDRPDP